MIAYRGRAGKRGRTARMPRRLERLYKEGKCRDCSVVVTRMDFAKILGKFTKVKIQYENSSIPKSRKTETPIPNTRLTNIENGKVIDCKRTSTKRPIKELAIANKKQNTAPVSTPKRGQASNILKENNGLKETPLVKKDNTNNLNNNETKHYVIVFQDPKNNNIEIKSNFTLMDLLPKVNKNILPSEDWCIDFFPKNQEPTEDKVYDRIAAELEDLMYNEKPEIKRKSIESKDDFPSILDILNDNSTTEVETKVDQSNIDSALQSSDVEAMLLGKSDETKVLPSPMEVDTTDVKMLMEFNSTTNMDKKDGDKIDIEENPHSPSILDEALQKGIEEHLPSLQPKEEQNADPVQDANNQIIKTETDSNSADVKCYLQNGLNINLLKPETVTHLIFKKMLNGVCQKSVTCPKNLKYSIQIEDKTVEFVGAPKYISNLDDLQVLLQIVNDTDLQSIYVIY